MKSPLVIKLRSEIIFRPIVLKTSKTLWFVTFFIKWRGHSRCGRFSFRRNYPNWVLKLGIVEIAMMDNNFYSKSMVRLNEKAD